MKYLQKLSVLICILSLSAIVSAENTNFALGGTASQSSLHSRNNDRGVASNAIDGNTDGKWNRKSVTRTAGNSSHDWWHLDLGGVYNIAKIEIYNHSGNESWLKNVHVMISETPFTKGTTSSELNNALALAAWKDQVGTNPGSEVDFDSINTTGRYILIQKSGVNDSDYLSLAEVEVYGSEVGAVDISQKPLFLTAGADVNPLVMINMSNDHQLFFEAYPDYADLSGDGNADKTYQHNVDYYGYFDSYKCYKYDNNLFQPLSFSSDKFCNNSWSGNFLNWVSMSRIDIVRKILYGGYRSVDTETSTILERSYIPSDAHSWVKYYDGDDLNRLTPYDKPQASSATSNTNHSLTTTDFRNSNNEKTFSIIPNDFNVHLGDQLIIRELNSETNYMFGVVTKSSLGSISVQVNGIGPDASKGKSINNWEIINQTRSGMSFCNVTWANSGNSQNITNPPLIKMAEGNYSLWTGNERWQCAWNQEKSRTGHTEMRIGDIRFSNGNDVSVTGIFANADNPRRGQGKNEEFIARVKVCDASLIGRENCKEYSSNNFKPIGLLQKYGDDDDIHFGILTGSYSKNKSGGMLRKNIGSFARNDTAEVDLSTGQFIFPDESIINTLNRLRVYGYSHGDGTYGNDNCGNDTPILISGSFREGNCSNWGNPQAEIYLESLRYLAGLKNPTSDFLGNDVNYIPGLTNANWQDPISVENYCAAPNIIQFNASTTSVDNNLNGVTDIWPGSDFKQMTNVVGSGENIHGKNFFVGVSSSDTNRYCTSKTVNSLGDVLGICPEGPNSDGSFHIAGLAHHAYTNSIRKHTPIKEDGEILTDEVFVQTYGVSLAPAIPKIEIPIPNSTNKVTILPACDNKGNGSDDRGRCALVDFKVIQQDFQSGSFLISWDIAEAGMDFDMDLTGVISYTILSNQINVSTQMFAQSSSRRAGFGYIISGTNNDGFHAHSGINGYNFNNTTDVPSCTNCRVDNSPTGFNYTISSNAADSLQDPLLYAAKWGGYNKSKTEQFPNNNLSWDSKGRGLPDNYFYAINPSDLEQSLSEVFTEISQQSSGNSTAVSSSSFFPTPSTLLFASSFDSEYWNGNITAFKPSFTAGSLSITQEWDAASQLPSHTSRNIITTDNDGNPTEFKWVNSGKLGLTYTENILDYIRGKSDSSLRNRGSSVIGDIINSNPVYVHKQHFGYHRLGVNVPEAKTYQEFVFNKRNRTPLLAVGANAGKLHGFDANTGVELFAYIPNDFIGSLGALAEEEYDRRYFVDGTPHVSDAYIDGQWKTILIGSLGAGGKSLFALDITDPDNFTKDNVMWEFKHADLGYTFAEPTIARLKNGTWVVIVGNGYNSNSSTAKLLVIDLKTGALLKSIDTQVGGANANGLSSAAILRGSENGNTFASQVYAGDLLGNLWKFDLNETDVASFAVANSGDPLFVAKSSEDTQQPITVRPSLQLHPQGGIMVMFGTGRYLTTSDASDQSIQSIYGIRDLGEGVERSTLQQQTISFRGTFTGSSTEITVLSNNSVNYNLKNGWVLDLIYANNPEGERLVSNPQLLNDRLRIATQISNSDPCLPGASSWSLELDYLTGGRLSYSVFDLDGDGNIGESDLYSGDTVSGKKREGPAVVGTILGDNEFGDPFNPDSILGVSPLTPGRLSWREVD